MTTPEREQLYFEPIKQDRGNYFVEYNPPISNNPFATLNIVYPDNFDADSVRADLCAELLMWISRYPVPIMASAFDAKDDVIRPNGDLDDAFLVGWFVPGTREIMSTWKLKELPAFLNDTTNLPDWRTIYKDIPFRTDAQVKADARNELIKTRKQNLTLKIILMLWVAVIPATWAVIQYLGPDWLAAAVLVYSFWQAVRAGRKLLGYGKPSRTEEEKAEKQRKMDHYFYHCERNPDGFSRLKIENFERDAKQRTRDEAAKIKQPVTRA